MNNVTLKSLNFKSLNLFNLSFQGVGLHSGNSLPHGVAMG